MKQIISNFLESYELGRINRRQLVQGLAAIAAAGYAAPAEASTFQGVGLNHIAIRVTDVQRSRDFYRKHLGMPVIHEAETNCFLGLGKNFLTLFPEPEPRTRPLLHCYRELQGRRSDGGVEAPGVESEPPEWYGPGLLS